MWRSKLSLGHLSFFLSSLFFILFFSFSPVSFSFFRSSVSLPFSLVHYISIFLFFLSSLFCSFSVLNFSFSPLSFSFFLPSASFPLSLVHSFSIILFFIFSPLSPLYLIVSLFPLCIILSSLSLSPKVSYF
jgi:hypothetical protein